MSAFPSPPPAVDPTPLPDLDSKLARLAEGRPRWVALSAADRASLLRQCLETTASVADRWTSLACQIKGYHPGSNGHGEEYLGGTLAVMRNLRLFAEALEAGGQPKLPRWCWLMKVWPSSTSRCSTHGQLKRSGSSGQVVSATMVVGTGSPLRMMRLSSSRTRSPGSAITRLM